MGYLHVPRNALRTHVLYTFQQLQFILYIFGIYDKIGGKLAQNLKYLYQENLEVAIFVCSLFGSSNQNGIV